ncbi:MAG: hypothetical protein ABIO35_08485, partial [Nitrobacter sp.]
SRREHRRAGFQSRFLVRNQQLSRLFSLSFTPPSALARRGATSANAKTRTQQGTLGDRTTGAAQQRGRFAWNGV